MQKLGFRLRTVAVSSLALLVRGGLVALALTAGCPRVAHAQDYVQQIRGTAGHVNFGRVLAVDGTTLVVGDPEFQDTNPQDIDPSTGMADCGRGFGVVEIYKLSGTTWTLNQTLKPVTRDGSGKNTNSSYNGFGSSVSLRNNLLVVSSPHEDYMNGDPENAGAIYVYHRTSSTAAFTLVKRVWAATPEDDGEFGMFGGIATNGTYIVAANSDPNYADYAQTSVFQYQGGTAVPLVTTIAPVIDRGTAMSGYFITNTNAVVMASYGEFKPTPIAYQLNGTAAPAAVNTGSTSEMFANMLPFITGDANTLVAQKTRQPPGGTPANYFQVVHFGTTGVTSSQDLDVPLPYEGSVPAIPGASFPAMTVKENKGIFLGYNNVKGQAGDTYDFISSFKYFNGTYYPGGVVREDRIPYANTSFGGSAVAYDGTYLFGGDQDIVWTAGNGCNPLNAQGAVDVMRPVTVTPSGPSGSKVLEPWMGATDSQMGQVVATNGTYALAGSAQDSDATSQTGEVTLFENVGGQWQQVDHYVDWLTGGPGQPSRDFGYAADIDNNLFAIGAPFATENNVVTGTVFASNNLFAEGPALTEVNPPAGLLDNNLFGWAVGVTGTTLAVGAPAQFTSATGMASRGAVYVYTLGSIWNQTQTLQPVLAHGNDHESFGWAVDVSGNNLIAGIPNRSVNGLGNVGAVQIFTLQNGGYVSGGEFNAPSSFGSFSQFGGAVSIGTDYAVVGARSGNSVVVYRHTTGTTWVQDATITPSGGGTVGSAVALEGTRLVFNSPSQNRVYRYERVNGTWQLTGTLTGSAPTNSFGSSLDIKNGTLIVGDPNGSTGASGTLPTGAAYTISITGF